MKPSRNKFDTPWKNIFDLYFRFFMEICHSEARKKINWFKGYEFLDTKLLLRNVFFPPKPVKKIDWFKGYEFLDTELLLRSVFFPPKPVKKIDWFKGNEFLDTELLLRNVFFPSAVIARLRSSRGNPCGLYFKNHFLKILKT
jgi:hypothetical protein